MYYLFLGKKGPGTAAAVLNTNYVGSSSKCHNNAFLWNNYREGRSLDGKQAFAMQIAFWLGS
jgi:hypothetical protein